MLFKDSQHSLYIYIHMQHSLHVYIVVLFEASRFYSCDIIVVYVCFSSALHVYTQRNAKINIWLHGTFRGVPDVWKE